jgi:hypothetical protein
MVLFYQWSHGLSWEMRYGTVKWSKWPSLSQVKYMKTFAEKAYQHTQIESSKSQEKIELMLEELGIRDVRFTKIGGNYIVEFLVNLHEGEKARKVRINIPVEDTWKKGKEGNKDQLFRVLFYNLKNRFVSIVSGLKEFEDEFLSDLVIIHEGKEVRIGDVLAPQYKALIKNSSVPVMHINQKN